MKKRYLVWVLVIALLASAAHTAVADDDEGGDDGGGGERDERDDDNSPSAPAQTVVTEVVDSGVNQKVIDALKLLADEVVSLKVEEARQNATINYLSAEVAALKANQDSLKAEQDYQASEMQYQNSTLSYLVSRAARPTQAQPAFDLSQLDGMNLSVTTTLSTEVPAAQPADDGERSIFIKILRLLGVV